MRAFQNAVRRRAVRARAGRLHPRAHAAFAGSSWRSIRRALIPRPETELLVEVGARRCRAARACSTSARAAARSRWRLKDERPDLLVTGSDLSEDALALARANGERLGLEVAWLHADLLAGVPDEFDAILSNPPYVAESERASLAPEILRHEPAGALFAGPDGLDAIRALLAQVPARATGCGRWRWRSAPGRRRRSCELIARGGLPAVRAERDLAGIERVVVGERGVRASRVTVGASVSERRVAPEQLPCRAAAWRCSRPTPSTGSAATRETSGRCGGCTSSRAAPPSARRRSCSSRSRAALAALPRARSRASAPRCEALLPGPVTLLLPNRARRFPLACGPGEGGADTLGLRVPAWTAALAASARSARRCSSRAPTSPASPTRGACSMSPRRSAPAPISCSTGASCRAFPRPCSTCANTSGRGEWQIVREARPARRVRDLARAGASPPASLVSRYRDWRQRWNRPPGSG